MKKVIFISTMLPNVIDNGKKVVLSGFIKFLVERFGNDCLNYFIIGGKDNEIKSQQFKVISFRQPSILQRLWNILWFVLLKRNKSIQESMLYSPILKREIAEKINEINPDLIIVDTFRIGQYFENLSITESNVKKVLYMDDLFSIRYKRMLGVYKSNPNLELNPLGNFEKFVPKFLKPILNFSVLKRWILSYEMGLVKKREIEVVNWFNLNLLINEEEAQTLRNITGLRNIRQVKPLIINNTKEVVRNYNKKPVFLFVGSLNIPHNSVSIINFIETQMEKVIELIPDVMIRIIGKGASEELHNLQLKYKNNISIEGYVNNLNLVFKDACAMLVPLQFGSGVKLKSLDALSNGVPVISTKIGMEGISVKNGVECFIDDNLDQFPTLMLSLLEKEYNLKMSENAKKFYFNSYTKEKVFDEYNLIFNN